MGVGHLTAPLRPSEWRPGRPPAALPRFLVPPTPVGTVYLLGSLDDRSGKYLIESPIRLFMALSISHFLQMKAGLVRLQLSHSNSFLSTVHRYLGRYTWIARPLITFSSASEDFSTFLSLELFGIPEPQQVPHLAATLRPLFAVNSWLGFPRCTGDLPNLTSTTAWVTKRGVLGSYIVLDIKFRQNRTVLPHGSKVHICVSRSSRTEDVDLARADEHRRGASIGLVSPSSRGCVGKSRRSVIVGGISAKRFRRYAPFPSAQPMGIKAAATSPTPLSVARRLNWEAAFLVSRTSTRIPKLVMWRLVSGLSGRSSGPSPSIKRSMGGQSVSYWAPHGRREREGRKEIMLTRSRPHQA